MTISKTPLLQRIEALEERIELLMTFVNTQGEINRRLVDQLKTNRLSEGEEKATGLILPARLNS